MRVLVYDGASPAPYDSETPDDPDGRVGGAELTVIRVATGLARAGHLVTVVQRARPTTGDVFRGGVRWVSRQRLRVLVRTADVVVVQRRAQDVPLLRLLNRRVRIHLWYHDWFLLAADVEGLRDTVARTLKLHLRAVIHQVCGVSLVVVSKTHAANVVAHLDGAKAVPRRLRRPPVEVIYNPTPPQTQDRVVDPDQLVYCSAAWKGLDQVLETFAEIRSVVPGLRLHVASPGYARGAIADRAGVILLGHLPAAALREQIASSLCVFYPASTAPETFGLVFTEAHALGTPVLAHPFGSAPELLDAEELVDAADVEAIIGRLQDWREGGRPEVHLREDLALDAVLAVWDRVLGTRSAERSAHPRPRSPLDGA